VTVDQALAAFHERWADLLTHCLSRADYN
jgi:hypothetical protein